ncbi:MAG: hypothetical protein VB099_09335 [Candidatus Limiplasma sp.]|nr:hypothetical protein [Candidatus Limiplasma sp.]
MLGAIWGGMILISIVYGMASGNVGLLLPGALAGAADAVALSIKLLAGYLFFCGMIEIVKALGVPQKISRALSPLLRLLFPAVKEQSTKEAIVLNFSANLLGLGNAATPMGIAAMERMEEERRENGAVLHGMYMFLVVNATSLQLLPTTVIALRAAAGSDAPEAILLPTLACTALSTLVGVGSAAFCARGKRFGSREQAAVKG